MADVRRNDRAPARHFAAYELRRQPFAGGDELHLRRDLALARVVQLRADLAGGTTRRNPRLTKLRQPLAYVVPLRTAGVVQTQGRFAAAQRHLTLGDPDAGGRP